MAIPIGISCKGERFPHTDFAILPQV